MGRDSIYRNRTHLSTNDLYLIQCVSQALQGEHRDSKQQPSQQSTNHSNSPIFSDLSTPWNRENHHLTRRHHRTTSPSGSDHYQLVISSFWYRLLAAWGATIADAPWIYSDRLSRNRMAGALGELWPAFAIGLSRCRVATAEICSWKLSRKQGQEVWCGIGRPIYRSVFKVACSNAFVKELGFSHQPELNQESSGNFPKNKKMLF